MNVIKYQGHGIIERATPATSIGHVMLHEKKHILDYEKRALMRGEKIIRKDVDIDYAFVNGMLVAVGGEASATFKKEEEITYSIRVPKVKPPSKEETPKEEEIPSKELPPPEERLEEEENKENIEELDQRVQQLRNRKTQLENKLRSKQNVDEENQNIAQNNILETEEEIEEESKEAEEIKEEIERIEQEIRSIEAKKAMAKQNPTSELKNENIPSLEISLNSPNNLGSLINLSV